MYASSPREWAVAPVPTVRTGSRRDPGVDDPHAGHGRGPAAACRNGRALTTGHGGPAARPRRGATRHRAARGAAPPDPPVTPTSAIPTALPVLGSRVPHAPLHGRCPRADPFR